MICQGVFGVDFSHFHIENKNISLNVNSQQLYLEDLGHYFMHAVKLVCFSKRVSSLCTAIMQNMPCSGIMKINIWPNLIKAFKIILSLRFSCQSQAGRKLISQLIQFVKDCLVWCCYQTHVVATGSRFCSCNSPLSLVMSKPCALECVVLGPGEVDRDPWGDR